LDPFSSSPALSRRSLLAAVVLAGCGRKRGSRYQGWLFVASRNERVLAVANLAQFRRLTTIPLPHAPDRLFYSGSRVYVTCRDGAELIAIDPAGFRITNRIKLPGKPATARILPGGASALIVTEEPAELVTVDLSNNHISAHVPLPAAAAGADLNSKTAAVSLPGRSSIARFSVPDLRLIGETEVGVPCGAVRFRKDGKTILTAAAAAREIPILDAASGVLLTRLSLPISPSRFCFNPDGGQMFVSGAGEDAVVIVNPYQNDVEETILAGRSPGAMAVSERQNLLFVANPQIGGITIIDIDTRGLCASVHVGASPAEVLITPDSEYALILDRDSGNVSVLRITAVPRSSNPRRVVVPLFTDFPTVAGAQSALIVPFQS
jgi:DNA-binding beta-propeller fold protein YncE